MPPLPPHRGVDAELRHGRSGAAHSACISIRRRRSGAPWKGPDEAISRQALERDPTFLKLWKRDRVFYSHAGSVRYMATPER